MSMNNENVRIEKDSMGTMEIPIDSYYGASTARAIRNFPISDLKLPSSFIRALALIKGVSAEVNVKLGLLDKRIGSAIAKAAAEIWEGEFHHQFVVDVFQTGSGTSTNMNANEIIANRAVEIIGGHRGSGEIHPNDHVNLCQSSNDIIPTTIHLASLIKTNEELIPSLYTLKESLKKKTVEFWDVIKTGRTHLQDATPIRLGQEFLGYQGQIEKSILRLLNAQEELSEVALGGTAVGTGVNAHPKFAAMVCSRLSKRTGLTIKETKNHFQAQSTLDNIVQFSGTVRTIATSIEKIANDIRWLGSGPTAGLAEITLPAVQPGSSIMPGKVNPVIVESTIQAVAQIMGNDLTISLAGRGGYFELNLMMPVAGYNLLQSIGLLSTVSTNFAESCVDGLQATDRGPKMVEKGLMLGTALAPTIGYDKAAKIAKEAAEKGSTIREIAKQRTKLSDEDLDELLDAKKMT